MVHLVGPPSLSSEDPLSALFMSISASSPTTNTSGRQYDLRAEESPQLLKWQKGSHLSHPLFLYHYILPFLRCSLIFFFPQQRP